MTDAQYKPVHWVNEFIFLLKPVRNKLELKKNKSHAVDCLSSLSRHTCTPSVSITRRPLYISGSPFKVYVKCKLEYQDSTEYNKS